MVPEIDTTILAGAAASVMMSEVIAGSPAATPSPVVGVSRTVAMTISVATRDDAPEEPEVIMGHSDLGALRQVSVPEVVDTTLFALQQVQDMFLREQKNLDDERVHLLTWGSMLKKRTASE
jgi:hypothetical protein